MMDEPFIKVQGLTKTFRSRGKEFNVLKGVDLAVNKGEIFGIVGFSGAGKSTLIRCINCLEKADAGRVVIGGTEITALAPEQLCVYRRKIGIIFQQFNLLDSRTVFGNVAFPLEIAGERRGAIRRRVTEILDLVGLGEKHEFYPGQLSGGQKQRVGIARALANSPDILLSDEATSALDPLTALSILDLLIDINKKLGLTIMLITHELDVICYSCSRVAVLENGVIAESGSVKNVFLNPASETAKIFMRITKQFSGHGWEDGAGI